MKRTIVFPHWTNNARTVLAAEFRYEDGRVINAIINDPRDPNNQDAQEVFRFFTEQEIEANTVAQIRRVRQQQEQERQQREAEKMRVEQEKLFAVKLKIFEIDRVKNSTNREMKSSIRRSKSDVEAYAYAAALLLSETQQPTS